MPAVAVVTVPAAPRLREPRSDRAMGFVPWVAAGVIVVLLFGVSSLAGHAGDTEHRWAWTIAVHATSYFMAAGYTGGMYFFVRVLRERRWHRIAIGFGAISVFVCAMMLATIIHWDKFHHGEAPMVAWTAIYVAAVLLVPGIWLVHRGRDGGAFDEADSAVPGVLRVSSGIVGAAILAVGVTLFVSPGIWRSVWPWDLTDLTGRVVGGWYLLSAALLLQFAADRRWSSWRIGVEAFAVSLAALLAAIVAGRDDIHWSRVSTVLFVGGEAALLVCSVGVYVRLQRRVSMGTGGAAPGSQRT